MTNATTLPHGLVSPRANPPIAKGRIGSPPGDRSAIPTLRIVTWLDPVADPHGVHPCSRYVELYWLPVIGPSTM
jgi:hypothetical protein